MPIQTGFTMWLWFVGRATLLRTMRDLMLKANANHIDKMAPLYFIYITIFFSSLLAWNLRVSMGSIYIRYAQQAMHLLALHCAAQRSTWCWCYWHSKAKNWLPRFCCANGISLLNMLWQLPSGLCQDCTDILFTMWTTAIVIRIGVCLCRCDYHVAMRMHHHPGNITVICNFILLFVWIFHSRVVSIIADSVDGNHPVQTE